MDADSFDFTMKKNSSVEIDQSEKVRHMSQWGREICREKDGSLMGSTVVRVSNGHGRVKNDYSPYTFGRLAPTYLFRLFPVLALSRETLRIDCALPCFGARRHTSRFILFSSTFGGSRRGSELSLLAYASRFLSAP